MAATKSSPANVSPTDAAEPTVSAVCVNFNAGEDLVRCAHSFLSSSVPVEMLVVDNGSTDESLARLRDALGSDPRVSLIENGANLGFARAVNRALPLVKARYLLLLNPDCVLQRDTLGPLAQVLDHDPSLGVVGPLVLNPDGSEQEGCRRKDPDPWSSFVRAFGLARLSRGRLRDFVLSREPLPASAVPVDAVSGAFMLVRVSAVEKVGPLDEGYFLHCEDLDWCRRFRLAGFGVVFVPTVTVTHSKGRSSHDRPVRVAWHMHRGMIRYYRKFLRSRYPAGLMGLVIVGVWLRFGLVAFLSLVRRGRLSR